MSMSKETFKKKVKKAVREKAFEELKLENATKTKTQQITFHKFETQKYIQTLNPSAAKIIFKCRSRTLRIKDHMKFKFKDTSCRWCGVGEETLGHIANCGRGESQINPDLILQEMNINDLKELASRVEEFLWKVDV